MNFDFARSTSQRRAYHGCGYLFLQRYGLGWRQRVTKGSYAFGDTMELVCNGIVVEMITSPAMAADVFLTAWAPFKEDAGRTWSSKWPWDVFNRRGPALAELAYKELHERIDFSKPRAVQERLDYEVEGVRETGRPDLLCYLGEASTVVDFKTSDRRYHETAAEIDEQLTDYQLGVDSLERFQAFQPVRQVALCVLIYQATPSVQWLIEPARTGEAIERFKTTVVLTDQLIREGVFTQNTKNCTSFGECAMMPLCYGSRAKDRERLLVREERKKADDQVIDDDHLFEE